jgi:hypothetical protein
MSTPRSVKKTKVRLDIPSPKIIRFQFQIQRHVDDDHYAVQYFFFLDGAPTCVGTCVGTYDPDDSDRVKGPVTELFYRVEMTEEERKVVDAMSRSVTEVEKLSDEAYGKPACTLDDRYAPNAIEKAIAAGAREPDPDNDGYAAS